MYVKCTAVSMCIYITSLLIRSKVALLVKELFAAHGL